MHFGYARLSDPIKQALDLQIDALEKFGCDRIYSEKVTGTRFDRPELNRLMDQLRPGDVVVVWKLDRLGRSTKQLIELVNQFEEMGVEFVSLQDSIDTTTSTGRFFFRLMVSFAELERDMISERTKAGLEAARARGKCGGRPKATPGKIDMALRMYNSKEYPIKEIRMAAGISKGTLYNYLRKQKEADNEK